MKITKRQLRRIIKEERRRLLEAGQMIGQPTTTLNPETGTWEAQDETSSTLKISSENAAAVEKAKSVIEQQLNSLYHNQMLENADLIAILEKMIKDINSGFVGEPT